DGVLFVVAAESTSKRVAKNALDTLKRAGSGAQSGRVLGAVLNMLPQSGRQNYYYYNYKSESTTPEPAAGSHWSVASNQ
ncbi:MAG: hypothetical protein ACJ78Q_10990, partial [Chloroflexia bacterium]